MKKTIICAAIVLANFFEAQTTDSNKNIPNIIPPSPTVNSLMKFEEVPVSNYTGIPDITIPIANIPTGLSNVDFNLALKYHVNNAKSDSKASETGLGWSLFAGGTISRTVMGSPDDQIVKYSVGGNDKIGIYFDENTTQSSIKNNYGYYTENLLLQQLDTSFQKSTFEAQYSNRFDTQYDLYQYNFLNYTGRFIVKKNGNVLNAVKLDKNNLRIEVIHTATYEPTAFSITDEFGNRFIFNILEKSKTVTQTNSTNIAGNTSTNTSAMNKSYNSAFHLSEVRNVSNELMASLTYDTPVTIQSSDIREETNIYQSEIHIPYSIPISQNLSALPKEYTQSVNITISDIRKLQKINIPGKGEINFEYENGREDTNYTGGENATKLSKLKSVRVLNTDGKLDQKFNFNYSYRNAGTYKRLFLDSVDKFYAQNSSYVLDHKYNLKYYEGFSGLTAIDDSFFKCTSGSYDPTACSNIELLRSITYPTTGMAHFTYEAATYSYDSEGIELSNFDENHLNWNNTSSMTIFNNFIGGKKYAFTLSENTNVKFTVNTSQIDQYVWQLRILKKQSTNYIQVGAIGTAFTTPPTADFEMPLQAGEYYLELTPVQQGISGITFNTSFDANYKIRNSNNYKFLFDLRGVKIKSVSYYNDSNVNNLGNPVGLPIKTVNYNYNALNDVKKSTGALVFPKPIMSFLEPYRTTLEYVLDGYQKITTNFQNDILHISNKNYLPVQKTKGSDIGYQYVTVSETGRGKSVFQYTSPVDQPNLLSVSVQPPFQPVPNYDFKRGNLINKKVYDNIGTILTEDKYQYNYPSSEVRTGIVISEIPHITAGFYLYGGNYNFYEAFVAETAGVRVILGTDVNGFLSAGLSYDIYGTAQLTQEEHIEYYPSQQSVSQVTNNTYNTRDYLIKKSMSSPDNSITESTYQYAHEKNNTKLINANMIGIPLETSVLKKQNAAETGKTISRTETRYDNAANLFPSSVVSYDLQNTASTEITYNQYDSKGNLQQYTTKDGIPTAIVWGYNQTQPIAKIVGATYAQVSSLAAAIISASDLDAANPSNEAALIIALDDFRKDSTMVNYQISTYTYDPLIGVTSITPPSGIREVYLYDSAGRLKEVREGSQTGKLLKEFKYNYKN